ncbi:MAG: excinuclease ABC subunit UvrC [Candidatus Faecousia sp.]|nr:excinuclease ABC subunit UvrC [Clostridiales bacterium]MDD7650940.1 excinuclease ABC subunit UvrC [Bacillota bacterium]MDY4220380.1 excinuclease ABC subunit UvrC [Candidatus Faecousia sp.]
MTFDELKDKALSLPLAPGVYIMRDESNKVIYVGKAKKLKNRVSQYFQDSSAHTPKTRAMVSKIDHFDVIVAASEFEALVLECSLIKRYMPKYNILLKDDKGYPYLRLDMSEEYPKITLVNKLANDGAGYYGPFGSRGVTQNVLDTIRLTLKLPGCNKQFPRDLGKDRPCLNYHMNQCRGWCQLSRSPQEYRETMEQARLLLTGNYKQLARQLEEQMLEASEKLEFERAAELRDRRKAVELLGQKQLVTAGSLADTDVVGFAQTTAKSCFVILHFSGGNLLDKEYEILPFQDSPESAVSSLVKQYYLARGVAPKVVLLPMEMEDSGLFSDLMLQNTGRRTHFRVPQRGDNAQLVELARENARREAERVTSKEERISGTLQLLGKMLSLETAPRRLESFDISNLAGTDIVASMVVFVDGKPCKKDYKRFKVEGLQDQDDYASMGQVVTRRFAHYKNGDSGFDQGPDVLLIDGGAAHAEIARSALEALGLDFPVFGMVKDDRHRTRALVTPTGQEIGLDGAPAVFALIGTIQEETHRFAITYNRELRSKRLRYSELDAITGIGPKRKEQLLRHFKSLAAIRRATEQELRQLLPADAAAAVYAHFHKEDASCE